MEFRDKEYSIIPRPSSHDYSEHKGTEILAIVKEMGQGVATTDSHIDWKDIHLTWKLRRKSELKRPAEKEWTVDSAVGKPKPQPCFKAEGAHATKAGAATSKKASKKPNAGASDVPAV